MDWQIQANLSSGSLISIFAASSVIPKNVSDVDGPFTFLIAKGTPSF